MLLAAELAAGGVDVAATAFADVGVHAVVAEDRLEVHDIVGFGALEGQAGDLVVADEVDVGTQRLADAGELRGMLGMIVYAGEEDVFQRDFAAGFVEVNRARRRESRRWRNARPRGSAGGGEIRWGREGRSRDSMAILRRPSSRIFAGTPTVETVILRAPMLRHVGIVQEYGWLS